MPPDSRGTEEVRTTVRTEILRFAVPGAIGMVLVALGSLVVAVAVAREQSLREAETTAQWLARTVVAPVLDRRLSQGRPGPIAALDTAFATTVRGSDVVAVRLWDSDGVMLYSDDPRLLGEQFPMPVLQPGDPAAQDADLARPENRYLDRDAETVEVNLSLSGRDGSRYLFQINKLRNTIQADAQRIWVAFAPVVIASLALLALLLVGLAVRMAQRISADMRARQDLLQQAVSASDTERRRIAADLHDGTVQDIAGLSYTLAGLAGRARTAGDAEAARLLDGAARQSQESVRELRSLLVDIYPPDLAAGGLAAALDHQLAALDPSVRVSVDIVEPPDLDLQTTELLYRIAREALTNIAKHAGACNATVRLTGDTEIIDLRITDDGGGFDPQTVSDGHIGLRLVRDLAEAAGGTLTITSAPGSGTSVELSLERR